VRSSNYIHKRWSYLSDPSRFYAIQEKSVDRDGGCYSTLSTIIFQKSDIWVFDEVFFCAVVSLTHNWVLHRTKYRQVSATRTADEHYQIAAVQGIVLDAAIDGLPISPVAVNALTLK
jgi:hypothetical protein